MDRLAIERAVERILAQRAAQGLPPHDERPEVVALVRAVLDGLDGAD